jgi:hypothetical protein
MRSSVLVNTACVLAAGAQLGAAGCAPSSSQRPAQTVLSASNPEVGAAPSPPTVGRRPRVPSAGDPLEVTFDTLRPTEVGGDAHAAPRPAANDESAGPNTAQSAPQLSSSSTAALTNPEVPNVLCTPQDHGLALGLSVDAVSDGIGLRLVAKNCGRAPLAVLHDALVQPSILHGVDTRRGAVLGTVDRRARMKFDNTVRLGAFEALAHGEARVLAEATIRREDSTYTLRWESFEFEPLKPGSYRFVASLENQHRDAWDDDGDGQRVAVPNVWIGSARSAPVTLALP